MSVYTKMLAVMKAVNYIQKDKRNEFHRYAYASDEAIKTAIHAAMVDAGLVFSASVERIEREKGLGKNGNEVLTTAYLSYRFIDADTSEAVGGTFTGTGCDPMDKGLYKAITGALKYTLTSAFLIPTGDDAEVENAEERRERKESGKQAQQNIAQAKISQLKAVGSEIADDAPPDVRTLHIGPPNDFDATVPPKAGDDAPLEPASEPKSGRAVPKVSKATMERFKNAKKTVGEEMYYRVLGNHGCEKANMVPDEATAKRILAELAAEHKAKQLHQVTEAAGSYLYDHLSLSEANAVYAAAKKANIAYDLVDKAAQRYVANGMKDKATIIESLMFEIGGGK